MENNHFIFYATPQGNVKLEVLFESETFWLSQKRMANLFGVDVRTVNEHLKNIFKTSELLENSVIRNFRTTAADGKSYDTKFYMLDAILAVGYRVNSNEATQFRIWATKTLKESITKGFVMDDERLKQGKSFGKDYFDELLERIREIRASERRFTKRLPTCMPCVLITLKTHQPQKIFLPWCKINCIGLLPEKQQLKLFIPKPMLP